MADQLPAVLGSLQHRAVPEGVRHRRQAQRREELLRETEHAQRSVALAAAEATAATAVARDSLQMRSCCLTEIIMKYQMDIVHWWTKCLLYEMASVYELLEYSSKI